jgi:hypothetical protein
MDIHEGTPEEERWLDWMNQRMAELASPRTLKELTTSEWGQIFRQAGKDWMSLPEDQRTALLNGESAIT